METMVESGIRPNVVAYTTLMAVRAKVRGPAAAVETGTSVLSVSLCICVWSVSASGSSCASCVYAFVCLFVSSCDCVRGLVCPASVIVRTSSDMCRSHTFGERS